MGPLSLIGPIAISAGIAMVAALGLTILNDARNAGALGAELERSVAANEVLRQQYEEADQRRAAERERRDTAEAEAQEARDHGEALAAQVEAMRSEPDPEICPARCFLFDWKDDPMKSGDGS